MYQDLNHGLAAPFIKTATLLKIVFLTNSRINFVFLIIMIIYIYKHKEVHEEYSNTRKEASVLK